MTESLFVKKMVKQVKVSLWCVCKVRNEALSLKSVIMTSKLLYSQTICNVQYSAGEVLVENLPRADHYKLENIIIVGCIPGPK